MFLGHPGLEEAVSYFWLLLGMGMVNVYVDCLEQANPRWASSWHHIALGLGFAVAAIVAWTFIPAEHVSGELTTADMSLPLALFMLASYGPLVPTLGRISRYCFIQTRSPKECAPAPGERIGLSLIGLFSGTGMLSFAATSVDVLVRLPSHASRPANHPLIAVTPIINAVSLCGLSAGIFFLLAGPPLSARKQRGQANRIRPLWEYLIDRYPDVHLTSHHDAQPLVRMTIEVHDALSLCQLPRATSPTAEAIVDGIRASSRSVTDHRTAVSAAQLVTAGRLTETDLAEAYNATADGDPHACDSSETD